MLLVLRIQALALVVAQKTSTCTSMTAGGNDVHAYLLSQNPPTPEAGGVCKHQVSGEVKAKAPARTAESLRFVCER